MELMAPGKGEAWVRVYDLAGHEVATLHRGALPAGLRSFVWDGHDQEGRSLPAGVYLVRADLAGESTTCRAVRVL
jgi:flagellar hook assembly protein FlgD